MTISDLLTYCQGDIITLRPSQKIPLETDWPTKQALDCAQEAKAMLALGYNLGYRIPKDILVLDIDPRNGGLESFERLPESVKNLPKMTVTPSGGFHIYTQLPSSIDPRNLRTVSADYPGIDFLKRGKQVVLPGSTLGNGLDYHTHETAALPLPETPANIISIIEREIREQSAQAPSGYLTNADLERALRELPVTLYNDNDSWLRVSMACHHATGGDGLPAFLAWSTSDPEFSHGHDEIIRKRWESMSADRGAEPSVTIRTLCRELGRHGVTPTWLLVRAGLVTSSEDLFKPLSGQPDLSAHFEDWMTKVKTESDQTKLLTTILLELASDSQLTNAMREAVQKQIARKTGVSMTVLNKDIKALVQAKPIKTKDIQFSPANATDMKSLQDLQDSDENQIYNRMASGLIALLTEASGGVAPMFSEDTWWLWRLTHWDGSTGASEIRRLANRVAQNHGVQVNPSVVTNIIETAKDFSTIETFFSDNKDRKRIYTVNHVLEMNEKTHQWDIIPHDYQYGNRAVVPTVYDPDAPPPLHWLEFLDEAMTSKHAQRTLACAIIYAAAECKPWLRKCFYLYGPPRSGKSTCLNTIEEIIGAKNCSSLNASQLGGKNHTAALVGKLANISNETVSKKAINDEIFKALVSGEPVMVEPKFVNPFSFKNTAKLFMAGNGFPRIEDESEAVWDRIVLFSFPDSCPLERVNYNLDKSLKLERASILKWALEIFREEHEKDECRSIMQPDERGQQDIDRWRRVNNPALLWARERTEYESGATMTVDQAYADYVVWCARDGHHRSAKNHFSRQVGKTLHTERDGKGRSMFTNIKLREENHFNPLD